MSVQFTWYQNESVDGCASVNTWVIDESPFGDDVVPNDAAYVPVCAPVTTEAVPTVVAQARRSPVSNPPFVIVGPGTVRVNAAACETAVAVPVACTETG